VRAITFGKKYIFIKELNKTDAVDYGSTVIGSDENRELGGGGKKEREEREVMKRFQSSISASNSSSLTFDGSKLSSPSIRLTSFLRTFIAALLSSPMVYVTVSPFSSM